MLVVRPSPRRQLTRAIPLVGAVAMLHAFSSGIAAQVVTPRTVPVQQSGQFDIFPSQLAGMAGGSFVLDDTLLDPFVNPAKATRVMGARVFTDMVNHSVMRGGGGITFPAGVLVSRGGWAAGGLAAIQNMDARTLTNRASDHARNSYLSFLLARRLGKGVSIGANTYFSDLAAIDGIRSLYSGSDSIAFSGKMSSTSVGLTKQWRSGRALELLVLHNRSDIVHDVRFPAQTWNPSTRTFSSEARFEHNEDRSRVWGAHTEFVMSLAGMDSARLGWLATANRLTHPKIPNYRFSNLPRDPGTTYAYNFGVGLGQALANASYGIDLVYEPMFSHTWAEAGEGETAADGTLIPLGTKTIENRFRFSNVKLSVGFSHSFGSSIDSSGFGDFQFGFIAYRNRYRLSQRENFTGTTRHQRVDWTEWGPTFGVHWGSRVMRFGYDMRLMCSPGACNIATGDDVTVAPDPGVIAAPTANLRLDFGHTLVHKFSLRFAIP